jgi:hypothetical protein
MKQLVVSALVVKQLVVSAISGETYLQDSLSAIFLCHMVLLENHCFSKIVRISSSSAHIMPQAVVVPS